MSSCLGIYIENNVIKYAKVSKEREILKVESFGMKFYDKVGEAIKQIVAETFSYKIPISINLSEEMYNYFYMFSLLNKKDLKKAIGTEFESYCFDKGLNKNAYESRYVLVNSLQDKEKIKVIHVSTNKMAITKSMQQFSDSKVTNISPIGISIANVANIKPKENVAIVNMEDKTTITTILNQKIYSVNKIEEGSQEVLDKISEKENSHAKAYKICKNTTIYTMEGKELQEETNEYLDDIIPTLYKIVTKTQEILTSLEVKIDKIYITGTLSVINNIDLYFQEFFHLEKCEILKPYFISENVKINMKDYVEVNTAIALALQGLGYGIKDINFKAPALNEKLPDWLKIEVGGKNGGQGKGFSLKGIDFSLSSLKGELDAAERWLLRVAGGIFILVAIYSGFSIYLGNQINNKFMEAKDVKEHTLAQIALVEADDNSVKQKTNRYIELADNLRAINEEIALQLKTKNVIPTLLSQIMYVIPKDVQLTSIENTTGSHIVIEAQAKEYQQLGYFKTVLKEKNILSADTVVSTQGTNQNDFIKIVIEGDLP